MQPKKEAAEVQSPSPTKTEGKKSRLSLLHHKLSIDTEPLLTYFEKKVTISKCKLSKLSQTQFLLCIQDSLYEYIYGDEMLVQMSKHCCNSSAEDPEKSERKHKAHQNSTRICDKLRLDDFKAYI